MNRSDNSLTVGIYFERKSSKNLKKSVCSYLTGEGIWEKGQEQAKSIERVPEQDVLEHEEQEQHAPVQTM